MIEGSTPSPRVSSQGVLAAATSALTLGYSAPMPGTGSRYSDGAVAHETRLLGVSPVSAALYGADGHSVGETVFSASSGAHAGALYADLRAAGYLAPLARAALLGEPLKRTLAGLSHEDARLFSRALVVAGPYYPGSALGTALEVALRAGRDTTLRDAMRFAAAGNPGDSMAREYARGFEVTLDLARPALFNALVRVEAVRPALVQAYLEVLAEVPDLDIEARAGRKEAEEVSRMANGVLKNGGVSSRRGLQGLSNLDGLLREDPRLAPTATEPPVLAAAFLLALEQGVEFLNHRVRPAQRRR